MHQVHDRLFVGSEMDCQQASPGWCVVHACKSPCHQRAVGYRGSLQSDHPNYLVLEQGNHLYLNMIDPPVPLFKQETFVTFLGIAHREWLAGKNVLVHCNQGESRAPTLALLLMAKRLKAIPGESYQVAATSFSQLFPSYNPGQGIQSFMNNNWAMLQ
jgi:hypothetical protein